MTENTPELLSATIPEEMGGMRLDQALASLFSQYSRARLQQWIKGGQVQVNGQSLRSKDKLNGGELIEIEVLLEPDTRFLPQDLPLDIVYEDEQILVINKPAGLVVHPAAGNPEGTMLNALLHHDADLANIPRAGIVHRLDKDTSGLLVVARTLEAQKSLVEQLQARSFKREYQTIVQGVMTAGGTVEAAIGRHPVHRKRMAVVRNGGKDAVTHYRVLEKFPAHTYVSVRLETGRTHQIRVHMAHINYPIVGDPVYGGRLRQPKDCTDELRETLQHFRRQALHAWRLGLVHPASGESMEWQQDVPEDMQRLLERLRENSRQQELKQ
ncbi:MAG: 23S rRNA pseudouridine(1911/1915/1917) synthase RluD [Gammaproteobacteria bacterium]|nr:23S rRNA pseudouridine(1911/1915/1917) synthase RluD [Gammaproteobacteria bacterium]MDH5776833.1 23S rRNA pseudouridine(1911/1915/1917) synthase RluD [Gammaproteobacteria bacterium]